MFQNHSKTIGILGGMGPAASAELYLTILKKAQDAHDAVQDDDYPHIIINSVPFSGSDETGISDKHVLISQFASGVKALEHAGADFVVMACNTAHIFYDELVEEASIPIIHLPKTVSEKVNESSYTSVGVLSSGSSQESKLYEKPLSVFGLNTFSSTNEEQKTINAAIYNAMGGKQTENDKKCIQDVAGELVLRGAQAIVLGCTELPLIVKQKDISVPVFDSIDIAADVALGHAFAV